MENTLQIIEQREVLGKEFTIYGDLENPLFLAKDVANWIEHSNPRVMLNTVDETEKVVNNVYTLGGVQESWFLTEDGLYEVLMQSRKPIAKQFKKEVKKILKTIRLNGMYVTDKLLDNPDFAIKTFMKLKEEKERRIQLEHEVSELKPQAMYCKAMLISDGLVAISTIAKDLGFKSATELNKELHRVGVQYKTSKSSPWQLYSKYADKGYAKTIPQPSNTSKGFKTFPHLYWTEAGKKFIYELKQQGVIQTIAEKRNEVA